MGALGERDEEGLPATIEYYPDRNAYDPFRWKAIVGRVQFRESFDPEGEGYTREETLKIEVKREEMERDGVSEYQHGAFVRVLGKTWALSETDTAFQPVVVTLGLIAAPLVELGARRNAV